MIRLELPFPPSVNTMFYTDWNSKSRHLSKRGREYRQTVYAETLGQLGVFKPLQGRIRATVELIPPDKRKRDVDNYNKALFDSLKHANCFMDDDQIKELHIFMLEPGDGLCTIIMEEM